MSYYPCKAAQSLQDAGQRCLNLLHLTFSMTQAQSLLLRLWMKDGTSSQLDKTEGEDVGVEVGNAMGPDVGLEVNESVGLDVGELVAADGEDVGSCVGTLVVANGEDVGEGDSFAVPVPSVGTEDGCGRVEEEFRDDTKGTRSRNPFVVALPHALAKALKKGVLSLLNPPPARRPAKSSTALANSSRGEPAGYEAH